MFLSLILISVPSNKLGFKRFITSGRVAMAISYSSDVKLAQYNFRSMSTIVCAVFKLMYKIKHVLSWRYLYAVNSC